MFRKKCLGNFRTKIAEVYTERVTTGFLDIFQCLYHMDLALHDTDGAFINIFRVIFCPVSFHKRFSPVYGKALRETVTTDSYDTQFDFWNVVHDSCSSLYFVCYV